MKLPPMPSHSHSWHTLARRVTLASLLAVPGGVLAQSSTPSSGGSCSPDVEYPVIHNCPASITVECVYSGQDVLWDHADIDIKDNCGISSVGYNPEYIGSQHSFMSYISATDLSGHTTYCHTQWNVVDTRPPSVHMMGPSSVVLPEGAAPFQDPGYWLGEDGCDGYLWWSPNKERTGSVNTGVPGTYNIVYSGWDYAGNRGSVTRQVKVAPFGSSMTPASDAPQQRLLHTTTRLNTGRMLVTGGYNTAAQEFDAQQGTWSSVGSSAATHRGHTATVLLDGRVLVAGGASSASEEVYNPGSKSWASASPMSTPRFHHGAVQLFNGRVLVAGGGAEEYSGAVLASAEVYNPATNSWAPTGALQTARRGHTMTLLKTGAVLITGGTDANGTPLSSAEIYNPDSGGWSTVPSMSTGRALHSATLLEGGKVLVVGGTIQAWTQGSSTELFDPATSSWTTQGSLSSPRQEHTATRLIGDLVLVTGGFNYMTGIQGSSEVYSPLTGTWRSAAPLSVGRYKHTATAIDDWRVVVVGGANGTNQAAVDVFKLNAQ